MRYLVMALVLVVVLAGTWFAVFFFGNDEPFVPDVAKVATTTTSQSSDPEPFSGFGTLVELATRGQTLECTITYEPSTLEPAIEGTYFIHQDKIRGDFIIPDSSITMPAVTSVIVNRGTQYIWTDINGELFGTMVPLTQAQAVASQLPVPTDARVQYSCKAWPVVDGSIFEPPAQVVFRDQLQQIEAGMEYGTPE